ncbi:pyridoxal-phosphate dependent enzyme [Candidatus Dojkabacteria bacterium]|nr:pyridoxal-phosphate dependent enzyme [Candidatus Dojkabacteria bacterium]
MQKGIWIYQDSLDYISPENRVTLNEGGTELEKVLINSKTVFFKHEENNPNLSFKDRSMAYWISKYNELGKREFVISSSGNAAVSAISYCKLINAKLKVFVSKEIPKYKFENILKASESRNSIEITKSQKPKSDAIKYSKLNNCINLRGSEADFAIEGFKTLGYELYEQNKDIDAVFVCCSSGTSTIGLAQGYNKIAGHIPQIHIVQTTKICPIASQFDKNYEKAINSIANAVSDKIAKRKENVLDIVKSSNGFGWVVSDQEIIEAKKELVKLGIKVEGYNAYVSYAGYKKSVKQRGIYKNPVCIISGV